MLLLFGLLANTLAAQSAHRYLRDGNYAYSDGNYAAAEEAYRRSLELQQQARTLYNLGNSLFQQKRYEEAVGKFEQAVESASEKALKADAYHNLGNTLFEMGDYKNSVEAYKNALRLRPGDASARYNLAQAQQLFLDNAKFDLALKLKPTAVPQEEGPKAGDTRTYNITVVNEGDLPAKDVGVVDYLPEGMKNIDPNWQSFNGVIAEYKPGIAHIPAQDSVTISVRLQVVDASDEEALFNAVEISKADNRYGKRDIDSTPGNAAESPQEDDFAAEQPSSQQQQEQQQDSDQQDQDQSQQNENQSSNQQDQQQSEQEQQQQQQNQQQSDEQQQQQQGGEKQEISPEEARRLLRIIEEEELQVMEKLKKGKGKSTKREKDW
ncbi:MAG: tetratricopeptide repeat protein [Bacteroidetes bacterium]|jgi:uncharacterized repeat protein (TIGR01451 family)|nr:tetratricopeptide repeat protein [Bacteroidota bacterium]